MKSKIFSVFLIIALLFTSPLTAFAEGDGNIDNGGGGMGNGTSQNPGHPVMTVSELPSSIHKQESLLVRLSTIQTKVHRPV